MKPREIEDRILHYLDRHHRVPAGYMIRLSVLWACRTCHEPLLRIRESGSGFECAACGTPDDTRFDGGGVCGCGSRTCWAASGDIFDADDFTDEPDVAAALCSTCEVLRPLTVDRRPACAEPPKPPAATVMSPSPPSSRIIAGAAELAEFLTGLLADAAMRDQIVAQILQFLPKAIVPAEVLPLCLASMKQVLAQWRQGAASYPAGDVDSGELSQVSPEYAKIWQRLWEEAEEGETMDQRDTARNNVYEHQEKAARQYVKQLGEAEWDALKGRLILRRFCEACASDVRARLPRTSRSPE